MIDAAQFTEEEVEIMRSFGVAIGDGKDRELVASPKLPQLTYVDVHVAAPHAKNIAYVSVHGDKVEIVAFLSDKKAKKLLAFLRKQCLYGKWNKPRPKLLKWVEAQGVGEANALRFQGRTFEEGWIRSYLDDIADDVTIVEQHRTQKEW